MNEAHEAAQSLKKFLAKFKGLIQLADTLDRIGSLELAASESETKVAESLKAEQAANQMLVEAKQRFELAEARISEAIDKAKLIEQDARITAVAMVQEASREVEKIEDDQKERTIKFEELLRTRQIKFFDMEENMKVKSAELAELNSKISNLKAELAKFLK